MKKSKKILAGIGLGLMMGTIGLLATGCSSDIAFNQADLDKALVNINEYLENQNNNNSEYVRNTLNSYLINGFNDSLDNNNISMSSTIVKTNNGDERERKEITFKRIQDGVNTRELFISGDLTKYQEITYNKQNDSYNLSTYTKTAESKTYVTRENVGNYYSICTDEGYMNYTSVYSNLLALLHSEIEWEDFIMERNSEGVVFKCTAINEYQGAYINGALVLTFKNNKIYKMKMINCGVYSNYQFSGSSSIAEYVFSDEVGTIEFDKTGFVLQA